MRTPLPAALLAALLAGSCAVPEEPEAPPAEPTLELAAAPEEAEPPEVVLEPAPAPEPVRDERADAIVRAMSEALRKAENFSVRIEAWSDEMTADGMLTALPTATRLVVRRPDRIWAERTSERGLRRCWYDGKTFAILDADKGLYARIAAPATIQQTVDMLADQYGLVMPLADLLADDPYDSYSRAADRVEYLGSQPVRGVPCHHVSFSAPYLQWQLWIASEGEPLPRRVQITYLDEPGDPRYLCHLDDWKLGTSAEAADFAFVAPPDAREIQVAPTGPAAEPVKDR